MGFLKLGQPGTEDHKTWNDMYFHSCMEMNVETYRKNKVEWWALVLERRGTKNSG